ncbi:MAG: hypothetical protein OES79_13900, partial [Planctomycetota bacterium]|nr:hypothetical protein [Planctomycetota bacterium]
VRVATVAGMVGYVCLLGCARWPETFGLGSGIDQRVPRYHQLMVLVGIGLCGIIVGQVVRRARSLAEDYARRTGQAGKDAGGS